MRKFVYTIIFLISVLILPFQGIAQNGDFEEGYVVTNAKDTLYGNIRDRKTGVFHELYRKIRFKGKGGKSRYAPREIVSYKIGQSLFESLPLVSNGSFFNDAYFVSPEGDYQFLKVLEKGYVSHYLMEFEDEDSGDIDNIAYFKKIDGNTLIRVNQGIFGLKRKCLAMFFSDCPELAQKIRTKQVKTAMEIVDFYNEWKANNL